MAILRSNNSFLDHGVDPTVPYKDGQTPLCIATQYSHTVVVQALESGIDPNLIPNDGKPCPLLASIEGYAKVAMLLLS
jgi:ankyrin repeat protein